MLLYFYSTQELTKLKSKNGLVGKYDKNHFAEDNHIAFFFQPIKPDIASRYEKHHFWKKCLELYQYTVNVRALPINTPFTIVQTPDIVKWMGEQDYDNLPDDYHQTLEEMEDVYSGRGISQFKMLVKPFSKGYEHSFKLMTEVSKKNKGVLQQALLNVPHVKMYVGLETIRIEKVEKIVLR